MLSFMFTIRCQSQMCLVAPGLYQGAEFSRKILELQKLPELLVLFVSHQEAYLAIRS